MTALSSDDLFQLEHVHDGRIAPDGRAAVMLASHIRDEVEIFELRLLDLPEGDVRAILASGRPRFPRWSPDGDRIAFVDEASGALVVIDRTGERLVEAVPPAGRLTGPPAWSPDGRTLAAVVRETDATEPARRIRKRLFRAEGIGDCDATTCSLHLYRLTEGGWSDRLLAAPTLHRPEFSSDGSKLLVLRADTVIARPGYGGFGISIIDMNGHGAADLLTSDWTVSAAGWAGPNQILFAGASRNALVMPAMAIWTATTGGEVSLRSEGLVGEIGLRMHHDMPSWETSQCHNILAFPGNDDVLATVSRGGSTEIWRIAMRGAPRCEPILGGDRSCVVLDADAPSNRILFASTDAAHPWRSGIASLSGTGEGELPDGNAAQLSRWPRIRLEHLPFRSMDGLDIDAWYLGPADQAGPLPSILFIHGGPSLAVGHMFRFDFHLLASAGYGVIFANFRGSAGYGPAFANAIKGDWGSRGFPDHIGAVDAAVARGLADPGRLGVWGASHGGFATAWIVGQTNRFRAAIVESGVSSFETLYHLTDAPDQFARDLGGKPHEIPDIYRSRSPLSFAHRCLTPTLLIHGADDLRCPLAEAEQFYRRLHDVGCPTELLVISAMDHMGDSTGPVPVRRAQNEALLDWFERYL